MWAYNAASLRTDGVMASRLGGKRLDGTLYASHPPLIVVETAVTQALGGGRPWSSRAPAWLGSLAALGLLYYLCLDAGFDPLVAGGAVALTGLTPMLITYGSMLDTPVTEFPFAIAVLICWYRDWRGERTISPYLVGALALVASLAGWQAAVLCGLCGLTFLARAVRKRPGALRHSLPYLIGAVVGHRPGPGLGLLGVRQLPRPGRQVPGPHRHLQRGGPGEMVTFQVPWLSALLAAVGDRPHRLRGGPARSSPAAPGGHGPGLGGRLRHGVPPGRRRPPVLELLGPAARRRGLGLRPLSTCWPGCAAPAARRGCRSGRS